MLYAEVAGSGSSAENQKKKYKDNINAIMKKREISQVDWKTWQATGSTCTRRA